MTRREPVVAAVTLCALMIGACSSGGEAVPATSSSMATSAAPQTSARLDAAECDAQPPRGAIDRGVNDLAFRRGAMRIAVRTQTTKRACFGFGKWGNADPNVPPDSLLFVFKGPGFDGAQIEFLVGELTGGVLPPIGDLRPTVGPLTAPITSQIGVSINGTYYHGSSCALSVSAMSARRAAGSFTCTNATDIAANPFDPNDDTSYDADELPSATTVPGSPATVGLTGWFEALP